jgi:hypothetical protein
LIHSQLYHARFAFRDPLIEDWFDALLPDSICAIQSGAHPAIETDLMVVLA